VLEIMQNSTGGAADRNMPIGRPARMADVSGRFGPVNPGCSGSPYPSWLARC
jgi:hypothetical protein